MKPVLFCDFDGVVNQFPFLYEKVHNDVEREEFITEGLEVITHGLNEYALRKQVCDEQVFFVPDSRFMAKAGNGEFMINYSSEMVSRLRGLIESDEVEFVWLTTWREHTVQLDKQFGFPEDKVTWLPWQQRMSDYNHSGKGWAIDDWFEEHSEFVERRWVWLDDIATRSYCNWNDFDGFVKPDRKLEYASKDCLILDTDDTWGISREQLNMIESFVS